MHHLITWFAWYRCIARVRVDWVRKVRRYDDSTTLVILYSWLLVCKVQIASTSRGKPTDEANSYKEVWQFSQEIIHQFLRNVEQVDVHTAVYVGTLAKHSSSYIPYNHLSVMTHWIYYDNENLYLGTSTISHTTTCPIAYR